MGERKEESIRRGKGDEIGREEGRELEIVNNIK